MKNGFVLALAVAAVAGTAMAGPYRKNSVLRAGDGVRAPAIPSGSTGSTDGPGWSDNFDSYANGAQLTGLGGWENWPGYGPPNNPTAFASNAQAASAPNSCRIALADPNATPPTNESDFVHQYNITGGRWIFRIKTYMPSTANQPAPAAQPYFILLRQYDAVLAPANTNWSVQVHFDKLTNFVIDDNWMGGGGVNYPTNVWTNQPLIVDQWVEVRAEIDLDVQDGNVKLYYNNVLMADHKWLDAAGITLQTPPPYTLRAVNLYDAGIDVFYFDDASLVPVPTAPACYPNCDGSTINPCLNVQDFGCFLNRFANGESYANCDNSTIAPVLNVQDFGCFLNSFANGCSSC